MYNRLKKLYLAGRLNDTGLENALKTRKLTKELLLEAKGFENVIVNLTGETADIVVPETDLSDAKRAQIEDIVKRKTGIAPENIVITPLNESEADTSEQTASMETSVDIDDDTP